MTSIDHIFKEVEAAEASSVFKRTSETDPVDLMVGKDSGALVIQLRSLDKPPSAPRIGALGIEVHPPRDGKWWTLIRLVRPELRYLFIRLAEDLSRSTRGAESTAGHVVMARLSQWQRLFAPGPRDVLSEPEKRGLAAELTFLLRELIPALGVRSAVLAWKGPFAAPRDFELAHCDIEVKAIRDGARVLPISSLEQLDASTTPLYIWVQVVDLGPPVEDHQPDQSLATLVRALRVAVQADGVAAEYFEQALAAAGYRDRTEYAYEPLTLSNRWCLEVRDDFPRIERRSVPAGVLACSYDISWPEVSHFSCDTWPRGRQ